MTPKELTDALRRRAGELGFSLCGVCPAVAPPGAGRLDEWLARGYAGQMHYLAERRAAYDHPHHVLEGARSVVMLALPYRTVEPAPVVAGQGRVARYAWGAVDYHDVIRDRLHDLADDLRELSPGAATRGIVDTAPLNEREFAQLAGLGWIGKNTLLLNKHAGSYFFLAALLTDAELIDDAPHAADHCGTCTACLDACPTDAFPQPYVMDASRCISYLTIEHRDAIPAGLRPGIGDWLFGCDVCQEVCPWNAHSASRSVPAPGERDDNASPFAPLPSTNPLELAELFNLTEADFRRRFRHTPLWRPHRRGLLRNAAIVLGNQRDPAALPALAQGLQDSEPLIRAACAWAAGRIDSSDAHSLLHKRLAEETDAEVLSELRAALSVAR
jgi:epoxyqueuosine reductase